MWDATIVKAECPKIAAGGEGVVRDSRGHNRVFTTLPEGGLLGMLQ